MALTRPSARLPLEDVYGRVISLLQAESVPDGAVRVVPCKLTQQDTAERVGSSCEMVSRILTELRALASGWPPAGVNTAHPACAFATPAEIGKLQNWLCRA